MKQRKRTEWTRLDNASKIFPATCNFRDTKVFRLVCELNEEVEPEILQQALNQTIESFPLHQSVLRRGVFWYYFEPSDLQPEVEIESNPICAPIYYKDNKNLLYRVFYYNRRINLEIFHALSDGTGALWFFQALIHNYIVLKHKNTFTAGNEPKLVFNSSISEKTDDSFGRHFIGENVFKKKNRDIHEKKKKAYHVSGSRIEEKRIKLIEGSMSLNDIIEKAHKYNTTITIFLSSLFIYSISKQMQAHSRMQPVILSVSVNLRNFFESATARNFFSTFNVGYQFEKKPADFLKIIQRVKEGFEKEVTEEQLNKHLNHLISLEKSPFTKIIPLPVKDYSLKIANRIKDRGITASISNIGRINMPPEFDKYIKQFSVCTSARRPQIAMCSYGDRFVVSFTSPFHETEIQRTFFSFLSARGIRIEISSNY